MMGSNYVLRRHVLDQLRNQIRQHFDAHADRY